jgi:hypothetical protein
MAATVTAATSSAQPALGGEQLDGLVLQQRGVDVHHDQPHGAAVQAGPLHRDVNAELDRLPRQRGAQSHRIGAGNFKFDAGNGAARESPDLVDVRALGGDAARDRGDGRWQQRPAEQRDVQPAAQSLRRLPRAQGDLGIHAHVCGERGDLLVDGGEVGRAIGGQ